jgi:hypothetical protein
MQRCTSAMGDPSPGNPAEQVGGGRTGEDPFGEGEWPLTVSHAGPENSSEMMINSISTRPHISIISAGL